MTRLISGCLGALGALLVALSWVPTAAAAADVGGGATRAAVADVSGRRSAERAPIGDHSTSEAGDYAAREAAAPELGGFEGGEMGIYIGGSALVIVLLVVLILIIL